ncbi:uncharacterized protein LOC126188815 [Schistocerca cancellata]|uniref:uncharacterized protein LOC126188815 n=1 Tax=Schistocerca cancellata TaxID=274614 RepID=UPI0021185655|nr:uncharacterized protein LOC126188815 [Schistocerca cancellata]
MHPLGVAAPLLALLAANGTTVLDCVCQKIYISNFQGYGADWMYSAYCREFRHSGVLIAGKTLQYRSIAVGAMLRLITSWTLPPWSLGYEGCDDGLAALAGLTDATANDQLAMDLACFVAADCIDSCSASGSNITEWNVETLTSDGQRGPVLSKLLRTLRHITKAISLGKKCAGRHKWNFLQRHMNKTELEAEVPAYLEHVSSYSRNVAQLLSHGVRHISAALVPFAFEIMKTDPNDELLSTWINHVEHMRDMLHTKLRGWIQDMQYVSEQTANYKVEEDKKSPGKYIIRLPLLNDRLLSYHAQYLAFPDDFSAQCEKQQPEASTMFALADVLYGFYYHVWFNEARSFLPLYEVHYRLTRLPEVPKERPIYIKGEKSPRERDDGSSGRDSSKRNLPLTPSEAWRLLSEEDDLLPAEPSDYCPCESAQRILSQCSNQYEDASQIKTAISRKSESKGTLPSVTVAGPSHQPTNSEQTQDSTESPVVNELVVPQHSKLSVPQTEFFRPDAAVSPERRDLPDEALPLDQRLDDLHPALGTNATQELPAAERVGPQPPPDQTSAAQPEVRDLAADALPSSERLVSEPPTDQTSRRFYRRLFSLDESLPASERLVAEPPQVQKKRILKTCA